MYYTVKEFCNRVDDDLIAFIDSFAGLYRPVSPEEIKAYRSSYPVVASMLKEAMKKNPSIGSVHISSSQLLVEYKLPAASAWCDVVLLGDNISGIHQVIIIELKNYLKKSVDVPASFEGGMIHNGALIKHPSDQVKGYTEYCQNFHSAVVHDKAKVHGCVYFTQPIDMSPYKVAPNDILTSQYPLYNTTTSSDLAHFISTTIDHGNDEFAAEFINGVYVQNRNILDQVARSIKSATSAKPFVLLDEQRLGYHQIVETLRERVNDSQKEVFIIQGPPGSGKSAIAANLWAHAVVAYPPKSENDSKNVVFVTTSSSHEDNWRKIFSVYGGRKNAADFILSANKFHPGITLNTVNKILVPEFLSRPDVANFLRPGTSNSLRFDRFRDYTDFMINTGNDKGYSKTNHFLCIVDEAHALWNPTSPNYFIGSMGWSHHAGPQAWHIINKSQVSVFLMDGKQSFRQHETTTEQDIINWAKELDAHVTVISLEGLQFRCAGSAEYVAWVEGAFSMNPIHNANKWLNKFSFNVVDFPSDLDAILTKKIVGTKDSARILSSYTEKWVSKKGIDVNHTHKVNFDFDLPDKGGARWQRYWNVDYETFVQATKGTMASNPLSEVGCPYVIRGFDIDHIGVIMMDDIFIRNGRWYINFEKVKETAIKAIRKRARDEQARLYGKKFNSKMVLAFDPKAPATAYLFNSIAKGYRILLSRAIKSAVIYIYDEETREYFRNLLK